MILCVRVLKIDVSCLTLSGEPYLMHFRWTDLSLWLYCSLSFSKQEVMDNSSNGIPQISYNSRSASPWQTCVSLWWLCTLSRLRIASWGWWPAVGHFLHAAGPKILNATVAKKAAIISVDWAPISIQGHDASGVFISEYRALYRQAQNMHVTLSSFLSHSIPLPSLMHSSCISPLFLLIMGYGNDDSVFEIVMYGISNARTSNIQNAQCKMLVQENNLFDLQYFYIEASYKNEIKGNAPCLCLIMAHTHSHTRVFPLIVFL